MSKKIKKGDKVRVATRAGHHIYHYAPVGATGTVVEVYGPTHAFADKKILDFGVELDGPVVSTSGKEHRLGFHQRIPGSDLVRA